MGQTRDLRFKRCYHSCQRFPSRRPVAFSEGYLTMTSTFRTSRDDRRTRFVLLMIAWAMATLAGRPLLAADKAEKAEKPAAKADALDNEPAQWMRFTEDKHGNGKLEVGIGTYQNEDGVKVHLVGAVHVADHRYYQEL